MRCNSDCVYERMGSYDGLKYCFGDSMYSQSECDADMGDGEEPVDMGPGSGDMGSGYGGMGSGSDGESPVDMGPEGESGMGSGDMGSGSEGETPVDMGSGSGSGGEDPVNMGSGSGSEDPVDMGSGSGSEDPVTMGPGSGSGSGSSGAFCAEKVLMTDCNVDCRGVNPDPDSDQLFESSCSIEGTIEICSTSWTILADNPAPEITLNCPALSPNPVVTKCEDGSWTVPEAIKETCGSSGSGSGGMMDHGSGSGSEDDGMMDHGSGNDGMMDHGSSSGSEDDGMMDHGSGSGSGDGEMGEHGDGMMGDHDGRH